MITSSAMNPALLLCLIICPSCIVAAATLFAFNHPVPASVLLVIGCYPLGIAGWQLIRFTLKDPDRLQREQHIENKMQIRALVGIKDHGELKEVAVSGQLMGNPKLEDQSSE